MIIKIDPVSKPRQTVSDKWNKRKCVVAYRSFADELRYKCNLAKYEIGESVGVTFIIPMPKSWTKKRKSEMEGKPHQQTPDIDNLFKAFSDALSKGDSFIYYITAGKFWGKEGAIIINE